jgi:mannose-1-phosphate guanylyltransferase
MKHFYAMIMAGGGGTRLWPMSRSATPKQLLPLVEDRSMFHVSVERLAPLFTPEQIYVVTGENYVAALRAETPEIPAENFIVEPNAKNNGPAALLGLTVIQKRDPEATVAILTADHHIAYKDVFRSVLSGAYELAQRGKIVTLGISPSFPSTAFGYIRRGEAIGEVMGFRAYTSLGFTEKPNLRKAMEFLSSGDYSWNSGMFIWRADQAMAEFERQQPTMYASIVGTQAFVDTPDFHDKLAAAWENVEKIAIDFAVMEGAENMAVIPVDMGWSDIGSWDALFDVLDLDDAGNGIKGHAPDHMMIDTKNTLVYSDKFTVTIGVENIVVVDTDDALMICHKDRAQDVKEVVNRLREANKESLL